ncbi:MAG: ankyrin repeat domain-containing protein [Pedobacter sp.]|nr:ankyrin repeat domain-containing protein [Pedobacter sp.]
MSKEKVNLKLIKAAKEGKKEAVEKLLREEADVNAQNPDGNTALHLATDTKLQSTTKFYKL